MPAHTFTDTDWFPLGTSLTTVVVQAGGSNIQIGYADNDIGFSIPGSIPLAIPEVAAMGGAVFARSIDGTGNIRYATA